MVGFRFSLSSSPAHPPIPAGVVIQRCTLTVTGNASGKASGTIGLRASFEQSASPKNFSLGTAIRERTKTTRSVYWQQAVLASSELASSPDLSTLLQEVVDTQGAELANLVVLIESEPENTADTDWVNILGYGGAGDGVSITLTYEYSLGEQTTPATTQASTASAISGAQTSAATSDHVQTVTTGRTTPARIVDAVSTLGRIGSISRGFTGTVLRNAVPLGPGSVWMGSWRDVSATRSRLFAVRTLGGSPSGLGGSLSLIMGVLGTGRSGMTGTFYGPVAIKRGSFTTLANTDAAQYLRVHFQQGGYARGSLSAGLAGRS